MTLHFSSSHALAAVAADHCVAHESPLIGGVACGSCWELAIRDDERFAIENDLPRELMTDPDLVDNVAVERAVNGLQVELTQPERAAALAVLSATGVPQSRISRLLRMPVTAVSRELAKQSQQTAAAA